MRVFFKNIKHTQWLLIFSVAAIGTLSLLMATPQTQASLFGKKADGVFAELQGFKSGSKVEYEIETQSGQSFKASHTINEEGTLVVPQIELTPVTSGHLKYKFKIYEGESIYETTLVFDQKTGKINLSGNSSRPFSDLEISGFSQDIKTKTDWSGLFENAGLLKEEPITDKPIQIAFYSRDIASDARDVPSKSVIKVLDAPGGGSAGSGNVNQYTESLCPPTAYPDVANLSTCDTGRVDAQNQNIVDNYVIAMQMMAEQLSAAAVQSTFAIGQFMDAKLQMETQRKHQELKAQAVKDYHPSEQMCRVGSYVRSLAETEEKAIQDYMVLNDVLMEHQSNRLNMATGTGTAGDLLNRLNQYRNTYCDPNDNDANLGTLCNHASGIGATDEFRKNKDIDFMRTAAYPKTLDINFKDATGTDDEEDILALGRNLYWDAAFRFVAEPDIDLNQEAFYKTRQMMALNALAHRSYSKQMSLKAAADDAAGGVTPGWAYMKTLMRDLMGATSYTDNSFDDDIDQIIGENPSYNAQMEILTKKIYQNPDFFTNLYDKPVNVDRILASLEAISLMQMRDQYELALRREMLYSGMVEVDLFPRLEVLNARIDTINRD